MNARDLRRRIIFAAGFDPSIAVLALDDGIGDQTHVLLGHRIVKAAADQALHRVNRVVRIGHRLTLGGLPDQALAIFCKGDDRRRRARAFCIFNNFGLAAFHHRNAAVGCAKIDTDNFCHTLLTPKFYLPTCLTFARTGPIRHRRQSDDSL